LLCSPAAFSRTPTCTTLAEVLEEYEHPGLKFVPGDVLPYRNADVRPGRAALADAYLVIEPGEMPTLTSIAEALAAGLRLSVEAVEGKLRGLIARHAGAPAAAVAIPLTQLIPDWAARQTGRQPRCRDANCWNATLNWYDPSIGERYTSEREINAALARDYRLLAPGSKLQFGDVVAMRSEEGELRHTVVYLDDNLAWHKPSLNMDDPWTFETLASLAKIKSHARYTFHRRLR